MLAGIANGCGARPASHESGTVVYAVGHDSVSALQGLFRVDTDGKHRTRLTQEPPPSARDPRWSPGGDKILFAEGAGSGAIWTISPDGSAASRIGEGLDASWSPDGTEIAVVTREDAVDILSTDGRRLRTIDLGLAKDEGLTQAPPAWSPDGRLLAVEVFSEEDPGYSVVYLAPADGNGAASVLTPAGGDEINEYGPVWSPDGERIAFIHSSPDGEEVWTCRPDGSDRRVVAQDVFAVLAWSTDGASVIAQDWPRVGDLEVSAYPLDGGRPRRLPEAEADRALAAGRLSPDGTRIVSTYEGGGLVVSRMDGSEPEELTKPVTYFDPVWSADGEEIAFAAESRGQHPESALNVVGADGKGLRRLDVESPSGHLVWGPVQWSPDGTTLLAEGGRQGIWQTAVISLESGRVRTIPDGVASAWSPDGTSIALVVNHPERRGRSAAGPSSILATIHRDGTGLRKLAEAEGVFDYPAWTPDGQSIVFAERVVDTTRIHQIPATGGRVRTLLRDPGLQTFYDDSLTVSPDGKQVALVSNKGIELISLASSKRNLIVGDPGLVTKLAWSPDGKELGYVAFPENGDEPARLYVSDADGSDRRLVSKPAESVTSFAWRPQVA